MKNMSVNFNTKSIYLDGNWYTTVDLEEKIKYNLSKGNYKVIASLGVTLEKLQETLNAAKEVSFMIDSATYEKYQELSQSTGKELEALFRNALYKYIITNSKDDEVEVEIVETKVKKFIPEEKPKVEVKSKVEIKLEEKPKIEVKPEIQKKPEVQFVKKEKKIPGVINKAKPSIIIESDNSEDDWFNR